MTVNAEQRPIVIAGSHRRTVDRAFEMLQHGMRPATQRGMRTPRTRYLVRSNINPAMILCTDGEFHAEGTIGPGTDRSAKLYKTRRGASAVRDRDVDVRPCDEYGVEAGTWPE